MRGLRLSAMVIGVLVPLGPAAIAKDFRSSRSACAAEAPICAVVNARRNETVVERAGKATRDREVLWRVQAQLNVIGVADNGERVLAETTEFATLPEDATEAFPVLQLYEHGFVSREFTLGELLPEADSQRQALRVGAWGLRERTTTEGEVTYLLASGRRLKISLVNGQSHIE